LEGRCSRKGGGRRAKGELVKAQLWLRLVGALPEDPYSNVKQYLRARTGERAWGSFEAWQCGSTREALVGGGAAALVALQLWGDAPPLAALYKPGVLLLLQPTMVGGWGSKDKKEKVLALKTIQCHCACCEEMYVHPYSLYLMCMQFFRSPSRKSARLASLQQGHNSPPTSPVKESLPIRLPPASLHQRGVPDLLQACNDDVEHEASFSQAVYVTNLIYDRFLHGHETSIEGESFEGGEEDNNCEEERMEEFLDWPPKLLFIP
jgi:hypothetical protein